MFGGQEAPNLYYDFKWRTRKEPSEWGYNYEYSECGTSEPTPREGHGTLWLVCNDENPLNIVKTLLNHMSSTMGNTIKVNVRGGDKLIVIQKATKETLCTVQMVLDGKDGPDPNVGQYAVFRSRSMPGLALLYRIVANVAQNGRVGVVEHCKKEIEVAPDYNLVVVTGTSPSKDEGDDDQGETNEDGEYHETDLSTRFTLFHQHEEVARCLMSYRDGSYDSSLGPTIECLSVKQSHRGQGLSKLLWYWVRCFIEENFNIECLNNDAPLGHIMIKTTQMSNAEIDTQVNESGDHNRSVSDHDFFYEYNRFQVRVPKGVFGAMMGGARYPEEEGVLYIPLLSTAKLIERNSGKPDPDAPMPGDATFTKHRGSRSCDRCQSVSSNHSKCTRCKDAFYCSRECQRSDWKRHKRWCGKSWQEVDELMVQEGYKVEMPDGNWAYSPQGRQGGGGF
jgi:hypothetical protein